MATTWYVAAAGSNSNSGTQVSPFLTLAYAITQASGGDTIAMNGGDDFPIASTIAITIDLTITSYGTGAPVLDGGTNLSLISTTNCVVNLDSLIIQSNIQTTVAAYDNMMVAMTFTDGNTYSPAPQVTNCTFIGGWIGLEVTVGDVSFNGQLVGFVMQNCLSYDMLAYALNIGSAQPSGTNPALYLDPYIADNVVHDIPGCDVRTTAHPCGTAFDLAFFTQTGSQPCFYNNYIYNLAYNQQSNGGTGGGMQFYYCVGAVASFNVVHDVSRISGFWDGDGMDIDLNNQSCVFEYNVVWNIVGAGFVCYSRTGGFGNNVIHHCLAINAGSGPGDTNQGLSLQGDSSVLAYSNTVHSSTGNALQIPTGYSANKVLYNNIFISSYGIPAAYIEDTHPGSGYVSDYNAYISGTGHFSAQLGGTTYSSIGAWSTALGGGNEAHGIGGPPASFEAAMPPPTATTAASFAGDVQDWAGGYNPIVGSPLAGAGGNLALLLGYDPGEDLIGTPAVAPYCPGCIYQASGYANPYDTVIGGLGFPIVAWYKLNEPAGTWCYGSVFSPPGTYANVTLGGPILIPSTSYTSALFNGTNSTAGVPLAQVTSGPSLTPGNFSWMVTCKPLALTTSPALAMVACAVLGASSGPTVSLSLQGSEIRFAIFGGTNSVVFTTSGAALAINTTYTIACVWLTSTTAAIYVNGVAQTVVQTGTGQTTATMGAFSFGYYNNTDYFHGYISNSIVLQGELTQANVTAIQGAVAIPPIVQTWYIEESGELLWCLFSTTPAATNGVYPMTPAISVVTPPTLTVNGKVARLGPVHVASNTQTLPFVFCHITQPNYVPAGSTVTVSTVAGWATTKAGAAPAATNATVNVYTGSVAPATTYTIGFQIQPTMQLGLNYGLQPSEVNNNNFIGKNCLAHCPQWQNYNGAGTISFDSNNYPSTWTAGGTILAILGGAGGGNQIDSQGLPYYYGVFTCQYNDGYVNTANAHALAMLGAFCGIHLVSLSGPTTPITIPAGNITMSSGSTTGTIVSISPTTPTDVVTGTGTWQGGACLITGGGVTYPGVMATVTVDSGTGLPTAITPINAAGHIFTSKPTITIAGTLVSGQTVTAQFNLPFNSMSATSVTIYPKLFLCNANGTYNNNGVVCNFQAVPPGNTPNQNCWADIDDNIVNAWTTTLGNVCASFRCMDANNSSSSIGVTPADLYPPPTQASWSGLQNDVFSQNVTASYAVPFIAARFCNTNPSSSVYSWSQTRCYGPQFYFTSSGLSDGNGPYVDITDKDPRAIICALSVNQAAVEFRSAQPHGLVPGKFQGNLAGPGINVTNGNALALAGTVTATTGSPNILGAGTNFGPTGGQLAVGNWVTFSNDTTNTFYKISSIASATQLTLVQNIAAAANGSGQVMHLQTSGTVLTPYSQQIGAFLVTGPNTVLHTLGVNVTGGPGGQANYYPWATTEQSPAAPTALTGTVTVTAGSTIVTGSGTSFGSSGQGFNTGWIYFANDTTNTPYYINYIDSGTQLRLLVPAASAAAGAGQVAHVQYLWSYYWTMPYVGGVIPFHVNGQMANRLGGASAIELDLPISGDDAMIAQAVNNVATFAPANANLHIRTGNENWNTSNYNIQWINIAEGLVNQLPNGVAVGNYFTTGSSAGYFDAYVSNSLRVRDIAKATWAAAGKSVSGFKFRMGAQWGGAGQPRSTYYINNRLKAYGQTCDLIDVAPYFDVPGDANYVGCFYATSADPYSAALLCEVIRHTVYYNTGVYTAFRQNAMAGNVQNTLPTGIPTGCYEGWIQQIVPGAVPKYQALVHDIIARPEWAATVTAYFLSWQNGDPVTPSTGATWGTAYEYSIGPGPAGSSWMINCGTYQVPGTGYTSRYATAQGGWPADGKSHYGPSVDANGYTFPGNPSVSMQAIRWWWDQTGGQKQGGVIAASASALLSDEAGNLIGQQ